MAPLSQQEWEVRVNGKYVNGWVWGCGCGWRYVWSVWIQGDSESCRLVTQGRSVDPVLLGDMLQVTDGMSMHVMKVWVSEGEWVGVREWDEMSMWSKMKCAMTQLILGVHQVHTAVFTVIVPHYRSEGCACLLYILNSSLIIIHIKGSRLIKHCVTSHALPVFLVPAMDSLFKYSD